MKLFLLLLFLFAVLLSGCRSCPDHGASSEISYREGVERFQDGQRRFKELIATIRDEESFDEALSELDEVVADWRELALLLEGLEPPSRGRQAEFLAMIERGNQATEPSLEELFQLVSVESREAEAERWMLGFTEAGQRVGGELSRLFGWVKAD